MNRAQIEKVEQEARRVVKACAAARAELREMEYDDRYYSGTKTSGALRRASMDLTRALAEMRKS